MIRKIDERISVAPQIGPEDVATLAAAGFGMIINNRPDGEADDQPEGSAMEAAARDAGLAYDAIPISHAGFSPDQIEAMAAVLDKAEGPVLAYCRSGTRSCYLWALASASRGGDPDALIAKAAAAGYDISPVRGTLEALAAQ